VCGMGIETRAPCVLGKHFTPAIAPKILIFYLIFETQSCYPCWDAPGFCHSSVFASSIAGITGVSCLTQRVFGGF
jgi:hypothetical protein